MNDQRMTRRRLVELGLALPPFLALADVAAAAETQLTATPEAADADEQPTPAQTEGPYFEPGSPRRRSIVPAGAPGTRLTISGRVLTTRGRPVRHALLDFWQADARGVYDNAGDRFRGHQFTDARGRYVLHTVVPGVYAGRTRHIHVKAQAPHRRVLTTQLYFPREPRNRTDGIFDADLLVRGWRRVGGRRVAHFDVVLDIG